MEVQYLVRLRHSMDDVPLAILPDKNLAIGAAMGSQWIPTLEDQKALQLPDMSTPVRIDVIEFRDGRPHEVVYVREYKDGDMEADAAIDAVIDNNT